MIKRVSRTAMKKQLVSTCGKMIRFGERESPG
jgi:hypothetical protein